MDKAPALDRERIENIIEVLVSLLDAMDGDENLEPWLSGYYSHDMDDREEDLSDWEPDVDNEPGTWVENCLNRQYETVQDENLEDNADYEPSLGSYPVCTKLGVYEDCEGDTADDEPWLSGFEPNCPCDDRELDLSDWEDWRNTFEPHAQWRVDRELSQTLT